MWRLNSKISDAVQIAGFRLKNINRINSEHVQAKIKKHIIDSREGLTSKDFQTHLAKKIGLLLPRHTIVKYLKTELNLRYKKWSIRILRIDEQKLFYVRVLQVLRLGRLIDKDTTIVSIDETSLARSVNNSLSWIPKGFDREVFSIKFIGSISLIMAITSSGQYLAAPIFCRVTSDHFLEFVRAMEMWLENAVSVELSKVVVLLDNCSTHRSRLCLEHLKNSPVTYMFFPQYRTQLAPIELVFSIFKQHIKRSTEISSTRWNSRSGMAVIKKALSQVIPEQIVACIRHSLWVGEEYFGEFYQRMPWLEFN